MARLLTAATIVLTGTCATPALGQSSDMLYGAQLNAMLRCHATLDVPHHRYLVGYMLAQFGETKVAATALLPGDMAELYVSPERGTWTIVRVSPHGHVCLAAAGMWSFGPTKAPI